MNGPLKYTPSPWRDRFKALSLLVHIASPVLALAVWLWPQADSGARWALLFLGTLAYLGYLVFALVLHLEYFPEQASSAAAVALLPPVFGALVYCQTADGLWVWAAAAGAAAYVGLTLTVTLLFGFGTKVAPAQADLPPGQSRLAWRREGHSMWRDPDFSPMTRWSLLLVFGLPTIAVWFFLGRGLWLFFAGFSGSSATYILQVTWWIGGLVAHGYLYLKLLVGLVADGRIFGPGRDAFH